MALTKSEELKTAASEKFAEANEILERSDATAEDVARGEALVAEAEADLARAETLDGIAKRTAALNTVVRKRPVADTSETAGKEDEAVREAKALEAYLRRGDASGLERAQNTADDSKGGVFVPTNLSRSIIDVIATQGPMLDSNVVTIWNSGTGEDFDFPTGDDRSGVGYEIGEGDDHTDTELSFGKVTLKSIEYGTGIVPITHKMKRDGTFPLISHVINKLGVRLGKILNLRFTNGNGTTQPQGLVTGLAAASRVGETAASTGYVWADFLKAENQLDEAYLKNAVWMMNRVRYNQLREVASTNGEVGIFQGNMSEGGPQNLLGRKIVINNDLTANQVVLGDLKEAFIVRQVSDLEIKTTKELFFRANMEGVAGFASYDARVVNPYAGFVLNKKAA